MKLLSTTRQGRASTSEDRRRLERLIENIAWLATAPRATGTARPDEAFGTGILFDEVEIVDAVEEAAFVGR